jgi:hypothetical protein
LNPDYYITAISGMVLIGLGAAHGEFVLPQTSFGRLGFVGTSIFYAFAMTAFFIAISISMALVGSTLWRPSTD